MNKTEDMSRILAKWSIGILSIVPNSEHAIEIPPNEVPILFDDFEIDKENNLATCIESIGGHHGR
ncbi:MAG: hypothetical protein GY865_06165 [candidate division Zixibacteria bacterium]|nr:hypothetical protein [candidate division Zixibacteria bacterium]